MSYKVVNPKKGINRLNALIVVGVVILIAGAGVYWWNYIRKPATEVITRAGNFSTPSSSSSSASSSGPKKPLSGTGKVIGGGTDTKGQATTDTSSSQWITSKSGNITVKQPIANSTLQSGSVLSGTAKVSTVQFRLIDNSVGVISEGTLNVVDGKFSGTLGFTSQSSTGQLDVFSTGSDGIELNEIQVSVRF